MCGVPSVGIFLRDPSSCLHKVRTALRNKKNLTATDVILSAADFFIILF